MEDAPAPRVFAPADETESGQKLLQFLERRLGLPQALLHRWIRTGQIRLNGARCKPFQRVSAGDCVRLPPFADKLSAQANAPEEQFSEAPPLPKVVGEYNGVRAYAKPAGLPTQSGTDHADSLTSRLALRYANQFYKPVACHRLDRDTSGLLLVGMTHDALRRVQNQFKNGEIHKEYLAWVKGEWPWRTPRLIRHFLRREGERGNIKTRVVSEKIPFAKEALALVAPAKVAAGSSLLQIRLLTGRRHQIRAQLTALGYPLIGDDKYGKDHSEAMRLHAFRIILPEGAEFSLPPDWPAELAPETLPAPLAAGKTNAQIIRQYQ